jgi:homoserine O-acetyltransferase
MPVFRTADFELASGATLAELEIAYECYGDISAGADNVILVTHGLTSSHHAAGAVTADRRKGWWSEVIGPGKVFDTDRYCIISPNMLGSCYGSTGPASVDPRTGRCYGPRFPEVTLEDIVRSQHLLLQSLGLHRLLAVAGSSLGGFQVLQWAVTYPDFMAGIIAMDTGPKDIFDSASAAARLVAEFSRDPNWNGGDYYATSGMTAALTALRVEILKSYGFEEQLKGLADAGARERALLETAGDWAHEFDANSLIVLRRATARYNVEPDLHRIRARLLYVLADSDEIFPASIGAAVMARLRGAGVDATYLELRSPHGHYATTEEPEKWIRQVRRFLAELDGA